MDQSILVDQKIADRYRVLSPLGEGAMGHVYLAEDTQLHRQVALKVLRREWVSRPEVAKRLENECRLMAHLGAHTSVVTLYDRLVHDGNAVLVMEYVPGETLADVLARTRSVNQDSEATRKTTPLLAGISTLVLTPRDAVEIALQCLSALDFAHSKGILHRDIKPSNVMIARDHNGRLIAKLMDFGIGKALTDAAEGAPAMTALTMAGGPGPGTPAYMAPEQIDPARFGPLGPAADLYALGITLYEMLTLRLPFEGTYTELLNAHTNVEPPDPRRFGAQISPDLLRVLMKALKKDPNARYCVANEFLIDLQAAGVGGGGTMILGGGNYAAPKRPRRRALGLPFALVSVALLLVAGGLAAYWLGENNVSETKVPSQDPAQVEVPIARGEAPIPVIPPATPEPPLSPPAEPPSSLVEARNKATTAKAEAEKVCTDVGQDLSDTSPEMSAWNDAVKAEQSQEWVDAESKYNKAASQFADLKESMEDIRRQKLRAETEKSAAYSALASARVRFRQSNDEIEQVQNYAEIERLLKDADTALDNRDYASAAEKFASAKTTLEGMNPLGPKPEPEPSKPKPPPSKPEPQPSKPEPEPSKPKPEPPKPEPTPPNLTSMHNAAKEHVSQLRKAGEMKLATEAEKLITTALQCMGGKKWDDAKEAFESALKVKPQGQ